MQTLRRQRRRMRNQPAVHLVDLVAAGDQPDEVAANAGRHLSHRIHNQLVQQRI